MSSFNRAFHSKDPNVEKESESQEKHNLKINLSGSPYPFLVLLKRSQLDPYNLELKGAKVLVHKYMYKFTYVTAKA